MRGLLLTLCCALTACQCVEVPSRTWACPDGVTCDAGPGDDAGPTDAGTADGGGADAGANDAGAVDGGLADAGDEDAGVDAGEPDAGPIDAGLFCNEWTCASEALFGQGKPEGLEARFFDLPATLDGGSNAWFGGLLLPDGRVLFVPHDADHFVTFDPRTGAIATLGASLGDNAGKFRGAVLTESGLVYAMPWSTQHLLELDPVTGAFRPVGPDLSIIDEDGGLSGGHRVGGVVDLYGMVWTPSESASVGQPTLRFDPRDGGFLFVDAGLGGEGGWWGMVRRADDTLLAFPKEYAADRGTSAQMPQYLPGANLGDVVVWPVAGFDLSTGSMPRQGGSLTAGGVVASPAAGADQRFVTVDRKRNGFGLEAKQQLSSDDAGLGFYGISATGPDGLVWVSPSGDRWFRWDERNAEELALDAGRYDWVGFVATPWGMVAVPYNARTVLMLVSLSSDGGSTEPRSMRSLLSPYFNKL